MEVYKYAQPFVLESGKTIDGLEIAYHVYGNMREDGSNVVWVCHALTANSDCADWWKGLIGEHALISSDDCFIVCANILGSCYGTTGPLSIDAATGRPYHADFPAVTIRDMVKAHMLLREYLGIRHIHLLMGGSMGGYQALEWSIMEKHVIGKLFLIATSPSESAWGVAVHTAQRLAIEADATWKDPAASAGAKGLKAARAVGMLTYRNYGIFQGTQTDPDPEKTNGFKAESYISYQGDKLVKRFNAYAYWLLTRAMDSHHLARGRGGDLVKVLNNITQPVLIMGIKSDILCPTDEQRFMAEHMADAVLVEIDSMYGHDGFIIETKQISRCLREWLQRMLLL